MFCVRVTCSLLPQKCLLNIELLREVFICRAKKEDEEGGGVIIERP